MEYDYCNGKHQCIICGDIYDCKGVSYGHTDSNSDIGNCHGPYQQFCDSDKHSINDYIETHEKLGEL